MRLLIEVNGESLTLDLNRNGNSSEYTLHGAEAADGIASVETAAPGVYSVLLGDRSFAVHVARTTGVDEVWVAGCRYDIVVTDARDRSVKAAAANNSGPVEVHAQMPGKVIKLLVEAAAKVEAGQGLIIVEAMKMQNVIKSPKDGVIRKITAVEGATVGVGDVLMVVG